MRALALALAALALPRRARASAAAAADGFVGFLAGDCPRGWSPLPALQGRLLLAVNNSYQAGESVGFPLSDGEDRAHGHLVSGAFDLGSRQVSALGGSDTAAAHAGKQPLLGFANATAAATSGFPFAALTACRYDAISFQPAPALPVGGVSIWDPARGAAGCPAGAAPLQAAHGRLLVLGNASGAPAANAAPPLEPGKDAAHAHAFSVSIDLDSVDFDGIHGCCDSDPATHGSSTASGASSAASLGLPYISVLACAASASAALALPQGMLFLTVDPSGCPAGWAPAAPFAGRALVATPAFGVPGRVWGGAPLAPGAYPAHAAHAFALSFDLVQAGVALVSSSGGDYGRAGHFEPSGATAADAPGADEQLPLAQVLACARV
jgi:hypothetical protein